MNKRDINYAESVEEMLNEMELSFSSKRNDESTTFTLPMHADNAPGLNVKMTVSLNGDSKLRCYLASGIAANKRDAVVATLNDLNCRYRFVCLSLDEDNDVCAAYDFTLFGDARAAGDHAKTMLFLITDIMDKCVPEILQTIWKDPKSVEPRRFKPLFEEEGGDA